MIVNALGQPEQIIRPEKLETPADPTPAPVDPKPADPTPAPVDPKPISAEGDPKDAPLDAPIDGDPKEPKLPEDPPIDPIDPFEELGGKEEVVQAKKIYDALTAPDFDSPAFIDELVEKLPVAFDAIALEIASRYPDWLSQTVLGVSRTDVQELLKFREDYLAKHPDEDPDEDMLKEIEKEDPDKAKLMRENRQFRELQKQQLKTKREADAAAFSIKVEKDKGDLFAQVFAPADEFITKAGFKPVTLDLSKPLSEALSNEALDTLMVRSTLQTVVAMSSVGQKLSKYEKNIENGQVEVTKDGRVNLATQTNRIANRIVGRMRELLKVEQEYKALVKQPAVERKEPPATGVPATTVPAGSAKPATVPGMGGARPKVGSKEDDALIAAELAELRASGKLSPRPN